jgi:hypothetical protein
VKERKRWITCSRRDRREGKVPAQLLIAPSVQHRLEHLLGRVEQRHDAGDLLPGSTGSPLVDSSLVLA